MKISKAEKKFGKLMAIARQQNNLTQHDVAKKLRISRTHVSNIESGRSRVMLVHALAMRDLFDLNLDRLTR